MSFSPDGQVAASATAHGAIRLWDVETGRLLHKFGNNDRLIYRLNFSRDGRVVVATSDDGELRLWDTRTGTFHNTPEGDCICDEVLATSSTSQLEAHILGLQGHSATKIVRSPDGEFAASFSDGDTLRLWNAKAGTPSQVLRGHDAPVDAAVFAPDSQMLASASIVTILLWDARNGVLLQRLIGHWDNISALAFSPSGQILASAAEDETVRLWDIQSGFNQATLEDHSSWVEDIAFSGDGKLVASVADDKSVRLWSATSGKLLKVIRGVESTTVSFDPQSSLRLILDGGARDLDPGILIDILPVEDTHCGSAEYGISAQGEWIIKGGEKIVWLPPQYRPTAYAVRGSRIFIGCVSGRVLRFSNDAPLLS